MQFTLNPAQREFFFSRERFPCFKGAWAAGKTMSALLKILMLGAVYKDNLLLVCRQNFSNLRQSTMKDWELYTRMKVKVGLKECKLPNGSTVLFSHADDVAGMVQNINLGGFFIEQGEEFDTSDVFTMLARGRMRRKLELDEHYFEQLDKELAIEPAKPDAMAFYDYIRTHHGENALNQGMVIANAAGRNWVWNTWKRDAECVEINQHERKWINPKRDGFVMWEADSFSNEHNLKPDFVKSLRDMEHGTETERRKYRMYVLNLDDEMDLEGAYYAKQLSDARVDGRIGHYPPDKSCATYTAWDLGVNDTTAIWWFQKIGRNEIRLVHAYENSGEGLEHYVRYVEQVGRRLGLHYGGNFWPHDGSKRILSTGKELWRTAADMGLQVKSMAREKKVIDGIERVRKMLPICTFHEKECKAGIEALEHYQRKKNQHMTTEDKTVFQDSPLHDWASNFADAFRYVSAAVRNLGGSMTVQQIRELQEMYS